MTSESHFGLIGMNAIFVTKLVSLLIRPPPFFSFLFFVFFCFWFRLASTAFPDIGSVNRIEKDKKKKKKKQNLEGKKFQEVLE